MQTVEEKCVYTAEQKNKNKTKLTKYVNLRSPLFVGGDAVECFGYKVIEKHADKFINGLHAILERFQSSLNKKKNNV